MPDSMPDGALLYMKKTIVVVLGLQAAQTSGSNRRDDEVAGPLNEEILKAIGQPPDAQSPVASAELESLIESPLMQRAVEAVEARLAAAPDCVLSDPRMGLLQSFWRAVFTRIDADVLYVTAVHEDLAADMRRAELFESLAKERADRLTVLRRDLDRQRLELIDLRASSANAQIQRDQAQAALAAMRNSRIWRATAPVRKVGNVARKGRRAVGAVRRIVEAQGGVSAAARKTVGLVRAHGIRGLVHCLRKAADPSLPHVTPVEAPVSSIPFRPYYLNPYYQIDAADRDARPSVALHAHLYFEDLADQLGQYLRNVPCPIDLYVSVGQSGDCDGMARRFLPLLRAGSKVIVERVPNRGRDIAPLIVQFGERLLDYEIVGHIHSKKSLHSNTLKGWLRDCMDLLFGQPGSDGRELVQIFKLLAEGNKVVYPEGTLSLTLERSGWSDNYGIAAELLKKYTHYRIEDFPVIEFPQGTMFWARSDKLVDFLKLPLDWNDFPEEPIPHDGTIAHALERMILLMTTRHSGMCIRLHRRDAVEEYPYYEDQVDFSGAIPDDAPKVLAYYLPQFHPTPENDEWHGAGFTEWHKVRAANPLFPGHYQQHIAHPSIGYYLLDSPSVLEKQADLMRKAGVHGQIFYHYWFGGRLILEHPAQMLLENAQIDMPYCFCWANENWTRRWDGNENEILLGQNYSAEDAVAFIRYLIPFFKDERYIRIDGRPVLFVYRASSIPDARMYVEKWTRECEAQGMARPYVIAVLTRGATDPRDFGMDGATERVLHDWTGGNCPNIAHALSMYEPFNGNVLNYEAVADYYMGQDDEKPYPYFRSTVPIWDNTARYGSEAYVVHGSTPSKFQSWMERLVDQSRRRQPAGQRYVIVNAWNEWAEGAHLEPDTRYGYAYLNSVGRALTNEPYTQLRIASVDALREVRVRIEISKYAANILDECPRLRRRFLHCLAHSTLLQKCAVEFSDPKWTAEVAAINPGWQATSAVQAGTSMPFTHRLVVGRPSVCTPGALEEMMRMSLGYPTSVILANAYGAGEEINAVAENMSVDRWQAFTAGFRLMPLAAEGEYRNFRLCPGARVFVAPPDIEHDESSLPVVTTVIRIHKSASLAELECGLLSLLAMQDCIVVPHIATQDFTDDMKARLDALVARYPWDAGHPPVIVHFHSPGGDEDLRATLLNESLRAARTRYVGILDYDDLMFPDGYSKLLRRMRITGKGVAFGRVYCALYDPKSQRITERRRLYEYGRTYTDFVRVNHAPVHSFLLDTEQVELKDTVWHADQKYMEDYHLTLQIFSESNADWESLDTPMYIGDYIHKSDGSNTLGIVDEARRAEILSTDLYQLCEARITALRRTKLK
jgi:lipopolysaccharide biosynthesis protein